MDLQTFIAEVPHIQADRTAIQQNKAEKAAAEPKPVAKSDTIEHEAHLRLHVPKPKAHVRLGRAADKKDGYDGIRASTDGHIALNAAGHIMTFAGEADPKKAAELTKDESLGQAIPQTIIAGALDIMKMIVAAGPLTLSAGALSVSGGIAKMSIPKGETGTLSLSAKDNFSAISGGFAQISSRYATTVWGSMVTKVGGGIALSLQGGAFASMSAMKSAAVVAAHSAELVAGIETEVASRFGETLIRGQEISIGYKSDAFLERLQRVTEIVKINGEEQVKITTSAGGADGLPPHPLKPQDALILLKKEDIQTESEKLHMSGKKKVSIHSGQSTIVLDKKSLQLCVAGSMEPSIAAFSNARKTYMEAMRQIGAARDAAIAAGSGPAMAPLAAAAAARAAADANYEAMKKAAEAAMEASRTVARTSTPNLFLEENEAELSTGINNGIVVSRVNGIKLESGAASITMSAAGITLKFGPSQITLSPAGIQIDAGPGLITQKASLVNTP